MKEYGIYVDLLLYLENCCEDILVYLKLFDIDK